MRPTQIIALAGLTMTLGLAACGNGPSSGLMTSSIATPQKTAATPTVDPACTALSQQISTIRQEGTPARVHAVATGKTKTANVKRSSLAKVAELDRLNLDFQAKCSKVPQQRSASLAPTTAASAATSAKTAANTAAKVQTAAKTAQQTNKVAKAAGTTPSKITPIVAVPR